MTNDSNPKVPELPLSSAEVLAIKQQCLYNSAVLEMRFVEAIQRAVVEKLATSTAPASVDAAAVPAGWKLVPVEPTRHMQERALYANDRGDIRIFEVREIYKAMLAASPAPVQANSADGVPGTPKDQGEKA